MQLEKCIKLKLKEVEHSSSKRDIISNYILLHILPVLIVPPIHQPALSLSTVHCCFPVAVLSHTLLILGNC